ncbi:MAG: SPOR domain-containing protein [Chitinispirillaceae bacterium]|nr:SPOR domain-containing protein [Chitinispirillaceae bacterium]
MILRTLLVAIAVSGVAFYGCAKKPKQAQQANVQTTAIPEPAAAPSTPKVDTGEVFDEYYKDSKNKKVDRTFSMSAEAASESYTPSFTEGGRYVVQIAAGPSSSGAEELANAFRGKGYPAYVAEVQNPTPELSGTYYRVRIGGFDMLADAKAFGENILRPANYDYWVDLKANDAVGTGSGAGAAADYSSGSSTYTPSYTPAASEPAYTPSTPATTTDYSTGSSSGTTTSSYDWSSTPSSEPSTTAPSTEPSWTTETPAATPPSADTGTGSWGGSSWK